VPAAPVCLAGTTWQSSCALCGERFHKLTERLALS
jgi:hypothetical protein